MIYIVSTKNRLGRGSIGWYYEEAPKASRIVIMRPFAHLSVGPMITSEESLKEYKRWLFKRLLTHYASIKEFTRMLDILIQEGDLVLECSCIPPKPCHGTLIRDALIWAEPFGTEGWHLALTGIPIGSSRNQANVSK